MDLISCFEIFLIKDPIKLCCSFAKAKADGDGFFGTRILKILIIEIILVCLFFFQVSGFKFFLEHGLGEFVLRCFNFAETTRASRKQIIFLINLYKNVII